MGRYMRESFRMENSMVRVHSNGKERNMLVPGSMECKKEREHIIISREQEEKESGRKAKELSGLTRMKAVLIKQFDI